jgi:hypothetical protein
VRQLRRAAADLKSKEAAGDLEALWERYRLAAIEQEMAASTRTK